MTVKVCMIYSLFFFLHTLPQFQPLKHQLIIQPAPQQLVMVDLGRIVRCL